MISLPTMAFRCEYAIRIKAGLKLKTKSQKRPGRMDRGSERVTKSTSKNLKAHSSKNSSSLRYNQRRKNGMTWLNNDKPQEEGLTLNTLLGAAFIVLSTISPHLKEMFC